jgi:uncharacterized membrane protein YedE/YeeE
MDHFTPISAILGGLLIGLAATLLWLANGRIAGISGIVGALPSVRPDDRGWRIAFLAGLILAPLGYAALAGPPAVQLDAAAPVIVVGGLLVGFGTRLGGGCTSGHGVCGLARLSPRSMVATALFMAAGFNTVLLTRHLAGG